MCDKKRHWPPHHWEMTSVYGGTCGFLCPGLCEELIFPELIVVHRLPAEHGEFLALDLGGTNFRVLRVRVTDNGLQKVEMENQIYAIPEDLMRGSGTQV